MYQDEKKACIETGWTVPPSKRTREMPLWLWIPSHWDEGYRVLDPCKKPCQQTNNACSPSNQRSEKTIENRYPPRLVCMDIFHFCTWRERMPHCSCSTFTIFVLAFASFSLTFCTLSAFSLLNFWLVRWWQHGTYKELLTSQTTGREQNMEEKRPAMTLLQSGLFCPCHGIHKYEASNARSIAVDPSTWVPKWLGCYTL